MSTPWGKIKGVEEKKQRTCKLSSSTSDQFNYIIRKFADSQTLPNDLRYQCVAAVLENEIVSMSSTASLNTSPRRMELFDHIQHIRALDNLSVSTKNELVQRLSTNYVKLKFDKSQSFPKQLTAGQTLKHVPKTLFPPAIVGNSSLETSVLPLPQIDTTLDYAHALTVSTPVLERVWTENVPSTTFPHALAALLSIDPCMIVTRTNLQNNFYVRDFTCSVKDCPARMRIVCSDADLYSANAQLFCLNKHCGHQARGWHGHYSDICDLKKTSGKGLPIHFRDMVDIFAQDRALEPMQIWRKVSKDIPAFEEFLISNGNLVYNKMKCQVLGRIKYVRRVDVTKEPLKYTSDLLSFKRAHQLTVPNDFQPQPILSEEHLLLVAANLERKGHLTGVKYEADIRPHRQMVVLDYPDMGTDVAERFVFLMKNRHDAPKENMVVFTSLALLSTICFGIALDWEICLSADGTHNIASNDYKLITIGVVNIMPEGTKRLHPLAYAWCPGELEVCVLVALHHIKTAVAQVFGIHPVFRGGMISDRSEVYVNAFKSVFPGNAVLQCYAHIIRKFIVDGKREHNGSYRSHVKGHTGWLQMTAKVDVSNLRLCRTKAMWQKGVELAKQAWIEDGQAQVWETFYNSYVADNNYNMWHYSASGIPGCVPQNQSNERITLETKGCSLFQGTIRTGRTFEAMMNVEFPKLICTNSTERVGLNNSIFPMMNKSFITHKERVLQFFNNIDYMVDVANYQNGFLVNDWPSLAKPLDTARIKEYEYSLAGDFELSYKERFEFFGRVNGLCYVELQKPRNPNAKAFYKGSCFDYFDNCWCVHAAVIEYRNELKTMAFKIPARKMTNVRRGKRTQMWYEDQLRKQAMRKKAPVVAMAQSSPSNEELEVVECGVVVTQTQDDS
jgi:hypothetical protein